MKSKFYYKLSSSSTWIEFSSSIQITGLSPGTAYTINVQAKNEADTSLEIGDQILKVNGVNIESKKQLDEAPDLGNPQSYRLKYEDFIGHSYLDVMEPLRKYSTSGDTIMNDDVYQRYRDTNQLLALLRKKVILNTFNERDQVLDSVLTKMINDIDDSEIWCLCNVLQEAVC